MKQSNKAPLGSAPVTIEVAVKRAPLVHLDDGWIVMHWPQVSREVTVSMPSTAIPALIEELQAAQATVA